MDIYYINFKKMNLLNKYYILLILLSTTFFVQFFKFSENNKLKKLEEKLDNQSDIIEKCIDIDNFGTIKLSQKEINYKII